MTSSADLKNLFVEARPVVEGWLDYAEQFAAFRDAARAKGIDWGQVKALLKATILDERDGGHRVEKLIEKADYAASYADMLGLGNMTENNYSREAPSEPPNPPVRVSVAAGEIIPPQHFATVRVAEEIDLTIPAALDRRQAVRS